MTNGEMFEGGGDSRRVEVVGNREVLRRGRMGPESERGWTQGSKKVKIKKTGRGNYIEKCHNQ